MSIASGVFKWLPPPLRRRQWQYYEYRLRKCQNIFLSVGAEGVFGRAMQGAELRPRFGAAGTWQCKNRLGIPVLAAGKAALF
jgi:hypothetical protein